MHRAHDYRYLIVRWRAVCRAAGLPLRRFGQVGKYPLHYLHTRAEGPAVYLSAGIHGDEPAGPEALIAWAESDPTRLRRHALTIFPCLNPWGLVNNIRLDAEALDLNRSFHLEENLFVVGWRKAMQGRSFEAALCLHEDYDGQGLYLYEVQRSRPGWSESLLAAAAPVIAIEPRKRVDSYTAKAGIIRRNLKNVDFPSFGYPEAIWLHLYHSARTFTVESPSEFALAQRVAAHRAVIDAALEAVAGC